jgi:hypothetical protein
MGPRILGYEGAYIPSYPKIRPLPAEIPNDPLINSVYGVEIPLLAARLSIIFINHAWRLPDKKMIFICQDAEEIDHPMRRCIPKLSWSLDLH